MMRRLLVLCLVVFGVLFLWNGVVAESSFQERSISAEQLAEAISQAAPGSRLVVSGGVYKGSLVIDKSLTLIGEGWPVIDGGGSGTVITILAADTTIEGFEIRGSGHSLDEENSGIAGLAPGLTIRGNRFVDTLFGIYLREAPGSLIAGNEVGSKLLDVPRRGDGIRVWSSNDTTVEYNVVSNARDVVLWYSERLIVRGNDVRNGRYGLHFMYCDDALITGNRLLDNSVGAFLMYSRRLHMVRNTVSGNRGPSGYGIGLKDVDDALIVDNLFLNNRTAVYLDGSPREVDSVGRFEGNVFGFNDIGVEMLPSVRNNQFTGNSFIDNEEHVAIAGGGTPGVNAWTVEGQGNFWSDYAGYDADGDGFGDIVYRSERLFENLMQKEPNLRLFMYSPVVNALDFGARALPIVKPQPKLVDERPLTAPVFPEATPPLPQPQNRQYWMIASTLLIVMALWLIGGVPRWQRRYFDNSLVVMKR